MTRLDGKVAIVTGTARGIGLAIETTITPTAAASLSTAL